MSTRPRQSQNFKDEKILIRKITSKRLIAHYIPYTSYCNTLLFILKLKLGTAKIPYRALLGIINSNLIGWYFRKKFQINSDDTFPQIMIRDILQFPIPNFENATIDKIETSVASIIADRKSGSNTKILEAEIDQLVYELYNLTEEEIGLIEAS